MTAARTIATLVLDLAAVTYTLECLPEHSRVRGNVQSSGDDAADRAAEDAVIKALEEDGNQWAWCCLKLTASLATFEGVDYLGGVMAESEADARELFEADMRSAALDALRSNLLAAGATISEVTP